MTHDQISFYDETLKKQIEGSFKSDGKSIHVFSAYGNKSVPYNDLGAIIDHDAQVLLVQKLLSELARDPDSGRFKERSSAPEGATSVFFGGSGGNWGCGVAGGSGTNP